MRTLSIIFILCLFTLLFAAALKAQWVQTSLDSVSVSCFATSGINFFAGTGLSGVFQSTDNGDHWMAVNNGFPKYFHNTTLYATVRDLVVSDMNLFAGTFEDGVSLSTNNGTSWLAANDGLPKLLSDSTRYADVRALSVSGPSLFAGTYGGGVFLSTNNGISWNQVNTGLTNTNVHALAVSGVNIYAGTDSGVFRSTNNGAKWNLVALMDTTVGDLIALGSNVFASAITEDRFGAWGHGVFHSTDDGISWVKTGSFGTEACPAENFLVFDEHVFSTRHFFNEGDRGGGVYLYDNDTTWIELGLLGADINALDVYGSYLFAGGWHPIYGSRVWRRPLSEMINDVHTSSGGIPEELHLEQNYPNPFNPSTTISYQLPTQSHVTLKIFDVLGREVATLVNTVEEPGYKSVKFHASVLPSSMYFYRLQAGNYVETKKLVLLK